MCGVPLIRFPTLHTYICTFLCFHSCTHTNTQRGSVGEGRWGLSWPESWPATPLLPAAKAQRSPSASSVRKKGQAESESAPAPRRRPSSILHDHSVIHEYYLRHGKSFLEQMPPPFPSSWPRTLATFSGIILVFCVLPHLLLSLAAFFYGLNQERCSPSIANWLRRWTFITWRLGVCAV